MKSNQELIKLTNKYVAKNYGRYPIGLVRGKGTAVWDASGKKYIDFVAGLAVNNLGHCPPTVVKAIRKQAGKLLHVSNLYHIEPQSQLASELTRLTFADKFFFCNSGTEANEAAIILARRWFYDNGQSKRYEIITMNDSFHGRTMASLSATAQKKIHTGFTPLLPGFKYVPFNNIAAFKKALTKKICAVLIEPIQGEGGVNLAQETYLKTLRKICNEKGILLIFDEIQTGFGRTGRLFAYERYKIKPDIITLAKALGGGIAIGAMGSTNKIIKSFSQGTHGATFGGNPLACAASLASLQTLTKKGFLQKASSQGDYFLKQLYCLKEKFPTIREVRGVGLMLAVELDQPGANVVTDCMNEGILINCIQQSTIRFLPPLIITRKEIDLLIKTLSKIFTKMQQ